MISKGEMFLVDFAGKYAEIIPTVIHSNIPMQIAIGMNTNGALVISDKTNKMICETIAPNTAPTNVM